MYQTGIVNNKKKLKHLTYNRLSAKDNLFLNNCRDTGYV